MRLRRFRQREDTIHHHFDAARFEQRPHLLAEFARELSVRPSAWKGWIAGAVAAAVLVVGVISLRGERQSPDRIRPLERMIHETRPFFYIKDADVAGRLAKVRVALNNSFGFGGHNVAVVFTSV